MELVKAAYLGERPKTPRARAAWQALRIGEAINEFELMQVCGGWLQYQAVPVPTLHRFARVIEGKLAAEAHLAQHPNGGGSGSDGGRQPPPDGKPARGFGQAFATHSSN